MKKIKNKINLLIIPKEKILGIVVLIHIILIIVFSFNYSFKDKEKIITIPVNLIELPPPPKKVDPPTFFSENAIRATKKEIKKKSIKKKIVKKVVKKEIKKVNKKPKEKKADKTPKKKEVKENPDDKKIYKTAKEIEKQRKAYEKYLKDKLAYDKKIALIYKKRKDMYLAKVSSEIENLWIQPHVSELNNKKPEVTLSLTIAKNGSVTAATISKKSNNKRMNQSVSGLIKKLKLHKFSQPDKSLTFQIILEIK